MHDACNSRSSGTTGYARVHNTCKSQSRHRAFSESTTSAPITPTLASATTSCPTRFPSLIAMGPYRTAKAKLPWQRSRRMGGMSPCGRGSTALPRFPHSICSWPGKSIAQPIAETHVALIRRNHRGSGRDANLEARCATRAAGCAGLWSITRIKGQHSRQDCGD